MKSFPTTKKPGAPPTGGFTLIELMLVVAIVALLAAIAIPKFSNLIDKSREAAMKGNMGVLRSGLTLYYADNEGMYPRYHPLIVGYTGLILLHDKYVDFNQIVFRVPRYAGSYPERTAMELYGDPLSAMTFNSKATVPPDFPPVHSAFPYPSYWNYLPVLSAAPLRVSLKTHAFRFTPPVGDILDTKGNAWSLW
jgi:prepilin-type N-terminal cleavage/methylation domain-containing protein